MGSRADRRRRWLGALFLFAALGMLIAGETVLRERLDNLGFVIFWLICLGFTCVAMLIALLDASAIRRRSREEQRAFLENTLKEIAGRKDAKFQKRPQRNNDSP